MSRNPILDELHETRRKILAEYNGDLSAYLREAQVRLEASGRPIAKLKQRRIRDIGAAEAAVIEVEKLTSQRDSNR
ncbi:hypothetical protein [Bythopirellula polymerisocia]|uniref:Uncharacterized protein n=1 Tax=Bythopirellula polymerisocia TaxID=2528003 RepID=A0A5C6CEQ9_9BACT|nr:hypothetical protein [Bythopirellula polymerisocia]TWU22582.1 hypothetical protein Pla144_40420 [Bythopirellula polymerisocia]